MVCVPCFIIPVLLYIWHKFVQPILLRYWNPWEKKDEHGNVIKKAPDFPFECKGGVCPYPGAKKGNETKDESAKNAEDKLKNEDTKTTTVPLTEAESRKDN